MKASSESMDTWLLSSHVSSIYTISRISLGMEKAQSSRDIWADVIRRNRVEGDWVRGGNEGGSGLQGVMRFVWTVCSYLISSLKQVRWG